MDPKAFFCEGPLRRVPEAMGDLEAWIWRLMSLNMTSRTIQSKPFCRPPLIKPPFTTASLRLFKIDLLWLNLSGNYYIEKVVSRHGFSPRLGMLLDLPIVNNWSGSLAEIWRMYYEGLCTNGSIFNAIELFRLTYVSLNPAARSTAPYGAPCIRMLSFG